LIHPASASGADATGVVQATNAGVVQASFTLLHGGTVDTTTNFSLTGFIFDTVSYTRPFFFASAPKFSDSVLQGNDGTLDVTQAGAWQYTLANSQSNVQALAQGQSVTDTFNVQAYDSVGSSATTQVT